MERKRLRNILLFLFLMLILLFGVRYGYDYLQQRKALRDDIEKVPEVITRDSKKVQPEKMVEQPVIEMEIEDAGKPSGKEILSEMETEEEKIKRYITGEHTVVKDESFSLITGYYWDDIFLWPDLYIRNTMRSDDPDLIYPDEIITVYNRLGVGETFSSQETDEILEAYLQVYRIYKKLGKEKNNSVWSLLWCAARYDHDFLNQYKDRIDAADRTMAQKYIDEQGFLD
ncbi:hypothetical protein [Oceanispirochaeta sp.]|jgi:hypothetical protein|uniref:hypothetical protein n=1 Tax=Oceanispirochaeta sp. TaxID=2035350 RepID=UPI00260D63CD|nr:hypothetical protein [Oceanispirochaeta sp.]MDA3955966.1 hypothetical protein [Oceanispirochaeta sp.]